jgi:photosystem II stability/assembly factor-like uncharacterized protein
MKHHALVAVTWCGLVVTNHTAFAQSWTQTMAPSNYWTSITLPADGTKLTALGGNACYTSTNGGATWLTNSFPTSINGTIAAASADGNHVVAATDNSGEIDVSTNGGLTWNKSTNYVEAAWQSLVSSANGKILVLTESIATVHASTNGGTTWYPLVELPNSGSAIQRAVMSASGNFLGVAVQGYLYTTTNFGKSWVTNPVTTPIGPMASSGDGRKLVTAPYGGNLYTSTNFGATWIQQTNSPDLLWWSCASSADGTRLAAVSGTAGGAGVIYTSSDAGTTWNSNHVPNLQWNEIISSADGNKLFASINGNDPVASGGIWTLQSISAPVVNLSQSNGNLNFSWLMPSTNFVLQQSADLGAGNWTTLTNMPSLNLTNLQEQLALPATYGSGFFRLSAQ